MPSPSNHPPLEPQRRAFGPFLSSAPFLRSCGMAPAIIFAFSGPISSGMASKRAFISLLRGRVGFAEVAFYCLQLLVVVVDCLAGQQW